MEKSPLIRERLAEQLRGQILPLQSNEMVRIPSERELSVRLQASRVSVRAAIRTLVREGLLVQLRGKGTYIVPSVGLDTLYLFYSPDIKAHDPYYSKFLVELTTLSAKQGIKLIPISPDTKPPALPLEPLVIIGQIADGLLDRLLSASGKAFAIQRFPHRDDVCQIGFDDYQIGYRAGKTLADYRHRRAVFLGGPDLYPSAALRKAGFLEAANKHGLEVELIAEKMNWEGGRRAAERLAKAGLPDAVFAVNDWMAVGFIQRLRESGIRIPEDISVIGCDDIPLASEISPRLTTFNLDMKLLVEELLAFIQRTLSMQADRRREVLLPAVLIKRDSLAYANTQQPHGEEGKHG